MATGCMENGKIIFDPGYDTVVGEIPWKGAIACRFASHFFRLLKEKGIPSHYIDTAGNIDEISPDVLRVCRGYSPGENGNYTVAEQCAVTNFSDGRRTIKNRNQVTAADFVNIFL